MGDTFNLAAIATATSATAGGGSSFTGNVQGIAADQAAPSGFPVLTAGIAVVASTYTGTYTAGQVEAIHLDTVSGGVLGHIRKLTITNDQVGVLPVVQAATIGFTKYRNASLSSLGSVIKGSAGNLYCLNVVNTNASIVYCKLFDTASLVIGTTIPVFTIVLAANGQFTMRGTDAPINFGTGIAIAAVTGFADNNSTAPGTAIIVEGEYV